MSYYSPPPPASWRQRLDPLLRLAIIAGLVGMTVGLLTKGQGGEGVKGLLRGDTNSQPIQADAMYRVGLALRTVYRPGHTITHLDPDPVLEFAIGQYERVALRRDEPNTHAMYRLAVIYSKRGYPEEGLKLFERLLEVDKDEARRALYLAVSSVYDSKLVDAASLQQAAGIIERESGWLARLVLSDLYRRSGQEQEQRAAEARAVRSARAFGIFAMLVVVTYSLLLVIGVTLGLLLLLRMLFSIRDDVVDTRPRVAWTPLDGLEAAAALLFAMAVVSISFGIVGHHLGLDGSSGWRVVATVVAYALTCGVALLIIWRRIPGTLTEVLRALGLGRTSMRRAMAEAVSAYAALVALYGILALAALGGVFVLSSGADLIGSPRSAGEIVVMLLLACAVAPLAEEVIFRGFLYSGLRQQLGVYVAAALSAAIFGMAHLSLAPGGMIMAAYIGVALALLYERSRSLWPCVIVHGLHNFIVFSIMVAIGL